MEGNLSQSERAGELKTPLGDDVLNLESFEANESIGDLFEYRIFATSDPKKVDFENDMDKVIGKPCTIKLKTHEQKERFFNGILAEARWVGYRRELKRYQLILRPWLWLLGFRADCRIFLNKDVKKIIEKVFNDAGFSDFRFDTQGDYDEIEYCVQYRETDLAFVSRLMEQYGIYYYFEPADGKHTLVLADTPASHKPAPNLAKVPFITTAHTAKFSQQHLREWISERQFRTAKIKYKDYDYLEPGKKLLVNKDATEKYSPKFEVYDYPGKYDTEGKGEKFAKFRLEAEQALDHRRHASGDAPSLFPGAKVTAEKHPAGSENGDYLVVSANHAFTAQNYLSGGGAESDEGYHGTYEFQPFNRPFRSLAITRKPRIYGIQTAKVVGKKGEDKEEISTDEHGRIWVQFYWDREPQKSCPVRVAQVWAGKQWGGIHLPRVGMEVVVEFLEGDPDRPLVTGCVYNGDYKVPYELADNKTQSGLKSESTKNGSGHYNEFMFEDKKGSEFIRMHAEKDHNVVINANQTGSVGAVGLDSPAQGGDQTWTVGGNRSWTIQKGDDSLELQMGSQTVRLFMGNQTTQLMLGNQTTTLLAGGQTTMTLTGITDAVSFGLSTIANMPAGVAVTSPTITLTGLGAITVTAPIINLTGLVLINGMLPLTIPVPV